MIAENLLAVLPYERLSITIMRNGPHQGLGNECIAPPTILIGTSPVRCRERLGGVLKFTTAQPRNAVGGVVAHDESLSRIQLLRRAPW